MNLLVTGGAGYLGSVLIPKLLVRGHQVRVLDIGYFGVEHLRAMRPTVEIIRDDIRQVLANKASLDALLKDIDVRRYCTANHDQKIYRLPAAAHRDE